MPQRNPSVRFGHGVPAVLVIAKSADLANAGATQHSPKQSAQFARSSGMSGS
jgi:hypothetical protein